jgi:hypothetical protein
LSFSTKLFVHFEEQKTMESGINKWKWLLTNIVMINQCH